MNISYSYGLNDTGNTNNMRKRERERERDVRRTPRNIYQNTLRAAEHRRIYCYICVQIAWYTENDFLENKECLSDYAI